MATEVHALPAQVDAFDPALDSIIVSDRSTVNGTGYRSFASLMASAQYLLSLLDGAGSAGKLAQFSDANTLTSVPDKQATFVYAGPAFGNPDASPTFRALLATDMPVEVARLTLAQTWTAAQTFSAINATGVVTISDGTSAIPGVRVTSEASGIYRYSATELGISVAGVHSARFDNAGLLTTSRGAFSSASNTSGVYTLDVNRDIITPASGGVYRALFGQVGDATTVSDTWYTQAQFCSLNITGSGSNSGYDSGLVFEANHRSSGTRANVRGAVVSAGTYNGGPDTTGTITLLQGLLLNAYKTPSSTITTSALIDLGANVGTTQFAIRTAANSGQVLFGGALNVTGLTTLTGALKLGNAAVAGVVVPTHTITVQDSTGTTYRIPVLI